MRFFKTRETSRLKKAIARLQRHMGLCDLLGYVMMMSDYTVFHKDGGYSVYFRYQPPDCETVSDAQWDYHAASWQMALSLLGDGWMVETHVQSQPLQTPFSARVFADVVSAIMDDERRQQLQQGDYYQSTFTLCLTYRPPHLMENKLRRFIIDEHDVAPSGFDVSYQLFMDKVNEFIQLLCRSMTVWPLRGDELPTFLYQCLTGHQHRLALPSTGHFLNVYLSGDDFIAGFAPKIGDHHIQVLAIDGLPAHSHPGLLTSLSHFPASYRWASRFVCLDKTTSQAYLKRYTRHWSSQAIGLIGLIRDSMGLPVRPHADAEHTAEMCRAAQTANQLGDMTFGFYNSNIILMERDDDKLAALSDLFVTHIQQRDFRVRRERVNATEAFLGSLPGHGGYNLRQGLVDSCYVSHALPTAGLYQGGSQAPCPLTGYHGQGALLSAVTCGHRPFYLNCHQGDVGHTLIAGPTGMGKTTLVATLMAAHRQYPHSRLIVLDKDNSNKIIIQALGGHYYDLSQRQARFAPLAGLTPDNTVCLDRTLAWLMDIVSIQGVDVTPQRQHALRDGLMRLAHEPNHYQSLNHLVIQEPACREAIQSFNQGQRQWLLNGEQGLLDNRDVVGFETTALLQSEGSQHDLSIPVLKALFDACEKAFQDKRPTILVLEEGWFYLRHPVFRRQLEAWFNTCRKANVSVWIVTPNLEHITTSQAAPIVLNACQTRLFLPNPLLKDNPVQNQAYTDIGLTAAQIETLTHALPKRDYFYWSPSGQRLFSLDLQAVAKAFVCVSDKADVAAFEKNYRADNHHWILDWLAYKGFDEWRDYVAQHYLGEKS